MRIQADSLRRVWSFGIRFHRALGLRRVLLLHAAGTAAAVLYSIGIAAMWPVLAMLSGTRNGTTGAMLQKLQTFSSAGLSDRAMLYILGTVVTTVFISRMACLSFFNAYGGRCAEAYAVEIRRALMTTYARVREVAPSQHARSTVLYLNAQIQQLNTFHWDILAACLLGYLLVLIIVANIIISPAAFIGSAAVIVLLAPIIHPLFRRTMVLGDHLFAHYHTLLRKMNDYIEGFDTLTTLNVRKEVARQIDRAGGETVHIHVLLGAIQGIVSGMPEVLIGVFLLAWIMVAGGGGIDAPLLAVAAYSIVRLLGTFNQLNEKVNELLKLKKTPEEIYAFLDDGSKGPAERPADDSNLVLIDRRVDAINFRETSVTIGGAVLVNRINVCLDGPGLYQFSGANGSGKSTALRAVVGLVPYSGSILIGSTEARDFSRAEISQLVSYHGQDNFLLEGSVLDNLLLGAADKDEDDVWELIRKMGLEKHPFLARGLDQIVAEGANNLSGGERQLLCILRTLVRETPVYILDEFTNHLGRHVSAAVFKYLQNLTDRIVIVVSHSVSGFAKMDVRFDHGRMLEAVPRLITTRNTSAATISGT